MQDSVGQRELSPAGGTPGPRDSDKETANGTSDNIQATVPCCCCCCCSSFRCLQQLSLVAAEARVASSSCLLLQHLSMAAAGADA